ncbi:unnamed protein product [Linum trigynum]|uniref:Uncharacterized protein n=1 Tax=Linum trigynum TaxID=586398 RepID=A0AAV2DTV6_9ROSI
MRDEAESQLKEKAGDSSRMPNLRLEAQKPLMLTSVQRKGRLTLGGPPLVARAYKMKVHGVGCKDIQADSSSPDRRSLNVLSNGGKEGSDATHYEGHVLEDSDSDEEVQCFEIKKRAPLKTEKLSNQDPSNRVSKVVAAFEAGLSLSQEDGKGSNVLEKMPVAGDLEVITTGSGLDEYGSNMPHPAFESRKRSLEHVKGVLDDAPSPKKQFVEANEVSVQVEEASLDWPQSDK